MANWTRVAMVAVMAAALNGCVLTKIVSVPLRVVGAAVSVVPVTGNVAHGAIDKVAEAVDALPF